MPLLSQGLSIEFCRLCFIYWIISETIEIYFELGQKIVRENKLLKSVRTMVKTFPRFFENNTKILVKRNLEVPYPIMKSQIRLLKIKLIK